MPARAIASGNISFGLVSVPVKLYTATRSRSVHFNLLHDKDHSRLKQQYICSRCEEVVPRDAMVKGYEYARGQYVVFAPDELKALEQQSDQSIEIEEFVPIEQVDPVYFGKTHLLGPDKGGQKAYGLLREAMARAGKAALAKFSTRGRQELVLLRETDEGLMLHSLYYADEVSGFSEIDTGDAVSFKEGEVDLAVQLIEQLGSKSFQPEKYHDEYRDRVMEMIEHKVAGEEVTTAPAEAPKAQIIDLMEALKASLATEAREESQKPARKPSRARGGKKPAGKASARGR